MFRSLAIQTDDTTSDELCIKKVSLQVTRLWIVRSHLKTRRCIIRTRLIRIR